MFGPRRQLIKVFGYFEVESILKEPSAFSYVFMTDASASPLAIRFISMS